SETRRGPRAFHPTDPAPVSRKRRRTHGTSRRGWLQYPHSGVLGRDLPTKPYEALRKATTLLWPPNPNEFESATSTCSVRASFGIVSRRHSGSGVVWLIVGGSTPRSSASTVKTASSAPAAPSACPVAPFVDETGGSEEPNARSSTRAS